MIALLAPLFVFQLAFVLERLGMTLLLDMFYRFDQALFDVGDFLIVGVLPLLAFLISGITWLLRKDLRRWAAALACALVFLGSAAMFFITYAIYEARGESVYGR